MGKKTKRNLIALDSLLLNSLYGNDKNLYNFHFIKMYSIGEFYNGFCLHECVYTLYNRVFFHRFLFHLTDNEFEVLID